MVTVIYVLLLVLVIVVCLVIRDYLAFRELEAKRIHERLIAGVSASHSKPLTGYDAARLAKTLGWTNLEHTDTWALGCPPGSEKRELIPLCAQELFNRTRAAANRSVRALCDAPPCP